MIIIVGVRVGVRAIIRIRILISGARVIRGTVQIGRKRNETACQNQRQNKQHYQTDFIFHFLSLLSREIAYFAKKNQFEKD